MATWPDNSAKPIDKLNADTDTVTGTGGGRSQLDIISQFVNSMLAAIGTGATPWTDANDGATSGLDADLLDGKQGALYGILATAAEWTRQQNFDAATMTWASPLTWDLNTKQIAILSLTGNTTMNNPTNMKAGGVYNLWVDNAGAFDITSWGSAFVWADGVIPTVTSGAGKIDIFTFLSNGVKMAGVSRANFS